MFREVLDLVSLECLSRRQRTKVYRTHKVNMVYCRERQRDYKVTEGQGTETGTERKTVGKRDCRKGYRRPNRFTGIGHV